MEKTMFQIVADFSKTKEQASVIEDIAKKIRKEKQKLYDDMSFLSAGWKGDNADAYMKKVYAIADKASDIADSLQASANVIMQMAQNTYDAEKESYEIAKNRSYSGGGSW